MEGRGSFVGGGGGRARTGAATEDLRERAEEMRQRIVSGHMEAQCKEKLFRDLDDARMAMSLAKWKESYFDSETLRTATAMRSPLALNIWPESNFDYDGAALKYEAAFAEFGLKLQTTQMEVLAQRIRSESPTIREALIVALDNWAFCVNLQKKKELWAIAELQIRMRGDGSIAKPRDSGTTLRWCA